MPASRTGARPGAGLHADPERAESFGAAAEDTAGNSGTHDILAGLAAGGIAWLDTLLVVGGQRFDAELRARGDAAGRAAPCQ